MTAVTFGAKQVRVPKRMLKLPREHRGFPVPVVAEWSSEQRLVIPPPEDPTWGHVATTQGRQGVGEPLLGNMNPQRQRRAMWETRCQVCDRNLVSSKYRFMAGGPMLAWFTEPWVCGPCMTFAVQVCPGLIRAVRHDTPLVVHHVHAVEFCQERIGFRPPMLQTKSEFYSEAAAVAADGAMVDRRSWLADIDFHPRPVDLPGARYTSMLYFIRAHVVESTTYNAEGFLAAFDWTDQ